MAQADDETWQTMPEEVQNLRVQVSIVKNLQSLKDLCLAKVAVYTLGFYCKAKAPKQNPPCWPCKRPRLASSVEESRKYQGPFKDLPAVLMDSLQRILEENKSAYKPRVMHYLVHENTVRLKADLRRKVWTLKMREALIKRIRNKGQNISELDLNLAWKQKKVNINLIYGMLGCLTNLTCLKLEGKEIFSNVVAVIGSCCPELRKLTLHSPLVSDEGLRYLYDSDLPCGRNGAKFGQCKKLTHLDVYADVSRFMTVEGLVNVVSNLPDLVYLKHNEVYDAIAMIAQGNEAQLKLQYLILHTSKKELENKLPSVISKVPDIRKLDIVEQKLQNVDEFLKLKHVNDLTLKFASLTPLQITSLITNFSQQLTKLQFVFYDHKIDISIIGFHCCQLTELTWSVNCTAESKHKLIPSIHFNKLRKVEFERIRLDDFTFCNVAMKCILASPCLEELYSHNHDIPDSVLNWIIEEAKTHGVVFSNLRELDLHYNLCSLIAKQILCVAPKLKYFPLSYY